MGWMQKCYETYENNKHMIGKVQEGKEPLTPMFFMSFKAQIEITITENSDFYEAKKISAEDSRTLIPITEKSASRANGIDAHPLCDQLQYIALGNDAYPNSKEYKEKYEDYIQKLKDWADSDNSHYKLKAVYNYCRKGTILKDLSTAGIVNCKNDGTLSNEKIEGTVYEKCLVRWRVLSSENYGDSSVWQDEDIYESYYKYFTNVQSKSQQNICYVIGEKAIISESHPKGTIKNNFGAKLISSNDDSGFTYRGRFITAEQALTVGMEVTQKAHSTLRWLAANQGVHYGSRNFICWNTKGKATPKLDNFSRMGIKDDGIEEYSYTMPEYRKRIFKVLNGYREIFEKNDDIEIIMLEAATTGRLSITYYNELTASDFIDRIEKWSESCCWYFTEFTIDKQPINVHTPLTDRIVEYAFGTEQGNFIKVKESILNEQSQRILHCIIDNQPVPIDIVHALAARASTPQAYMKYNHENILSVACALIRKYRNEKNESEEWKMDLDLSCENRSYIFGRLLAVAEKIERTTFGRDDGGREPNAIRLQSAFVQHPMHTWSIIEKALIPYYAKLNPGLRKYYKDLTGEILSLLHMSDISQLNKSLEDVYLLGYYLQRKELYKYNKNNEKQEDENYVNTTEKN